MRHTLWVLALTAGCDLFSGIGDADITADPYPVDDLSCRYGLEPTDDASLYIDQLAMDGYSVYANFNPTGIYEGDEAAACVASNGRAAGFVIEVDGVQAGYLYIEVPDVGPFSVPDGEADMAIQLDLGDASYALTGTDFTTGVITTSSVDKRLTGDAYGQATDSAYAQVQFGFDVGVPEQGSTVTTD